MKDIKFKSVKNDAGLSEWKEGMVEANDYVKVLKQRVKELDNIVDRIQPLAINAEANDDYGYFSGEKRKLKHNEYFKNSRLFVQQMDKFNKQMKRVQQVVDLLEDLSLYRAIRY